MLGSGYECGLISNGTCHVVYVVCRVSGTERFPDDDDPEREAALHLGQCGRVLGPLDGEYIVYVWCVCVCNLR